MSIRGKFGAACLFTLVFALYFLVVGIVGNIAVRAAFPKADETITREDILSGEATERLRDARRRSEARSQAVTIAGLATTVLSVMLSFLTCLDRMPFGGYRLRLTRSDPSTNPAEVFA